jgi:CRISPR-associated protein Cas1
VASGFSPPRDPINSMLSFGYTLLFHNIYGIVERVGFNPLIGIFHDAYKRSPALVSDLMEEFRAPVVESCVLGVVGRRVLCPDDFRSEKDPKRGTTGCYLHDHARRRFIASFEQTLSRQIRHPLFGITGDFRRMIHLQVLHLGYVLKCNEPYRPFRIR